MDGSAPIDFFSILKPGGNQTNRQGGPENPAVLLDQSGMASRNKRKLDIVSIENPDVSRGKQRLEVSDTISSMDDPLNKGKAPMASRCPVPLCRWCRKDINSCEALAGLNKERKLCSLVPPPPQVNFFQDKQKRYQQVDCPWCKKTFVNRFAVSGHSQFCRQRKEQLAANPEWRRLVVPVWKFDLNLTPEEWAAQKGRVKRC